MNSPSDWLLELERLSLKYSHLGVSADLAALTYADAYALLTWLRSLEGAS